MNEEITPGQLRACFKAILAFLGQGAKNPIMAVCLFLAPMGWALVNLIKMVFEDSGHWRHQPLQLFGTTIVATLTAAKLWNNAKTAIELEGKERDDDKARAQGRDTATRFGGMLRALQLAMNDLPYLWQSPCTSNSVRPLPIVGLFNDWWYSCVAPTIGKASLDDPQTVQQAAHALNNFLNRVHLTVTGGHLPPPGQEFKDLHNRVVKGINDAAASCRDVEWIPRSCL